MYDSWTRPHCLHWTNQGRSLLSHTTPIPEATAQGLEGRQKVAQRVSAGFRPPMQKAPAGATEFPPFHDCPSPQTCAPPWDRDRDRERVRNRVRAQPACSTSFSIPMAIPIPIPTRATKAAARADRQSSACLPGLLPMENRLRLGIDSDEGPSACCRYPGGISANSPGSRSAPRVIRQNGFLPWKGCRSCLNASAFRRLNG